MKVPITDLDYVKLYAQKLKNNPRLFKQQKMLIDSQIKISKEIFSKRFSKQNFKTSGKQGFPWHKKSDRFFREDARKYLKDIGLIK